MLREFLR
jgi:hypothetical protein